MNDLKYKYEVFIWIWRLDFFFFLSGFSASSDSLEKLLNVVEVHVLPDCVLHQRSWGARAKAFQAMHTIKRDVINLNPAGLTPTVGHDLQGQRQQVIEGGIQHDWLDLWVRHRCPAGWDRTESHRGVQVNEKLCGLTLEYALHSTTKALITEGYGAICSWKNGGSGALDWTMSAHCIRQITLNFLNSVWHHSGLVVPVKPPMDQAYTMMSLSWKPSLCIANWITTSMALASFWGNGSPWWNKQVKHDATVIQFPQSSLTPILTACLDLIMSCTERGRSILYFAYSLLLCTKVTEFWKSAFCEVTKGHWMALSPRFRCLFHPQTCFCPRPIEQSQRRLKLWAFLRWTCCFLEMCRM